MSFLEPLIRTAVLGSVGIGCKLFLRTSVNLTVHNAAVLHRLVMERAGDKPLLTISNHTSTLDDPLIWGALLPFSIIVAEWGRRMRWTLGAEEVIFTNPLFRAFFRHGKVLPIRRGEGITQPAMEMALDLMAGGQWLHVFPEGKVCPDSAQLGEKLRWGVGRLVSEAPVKPIVLPIIHRGMERIRPFEQGWTIRHGESLDITVGDPIDMAEHYQELKGENEQLTRRSITWFLQEHMAKYYR